MEEFCVKYIQNREYLDKIELVLVLLNHDAVEGLKKSINFLPENEMYDYPVLREDIDPLDL